ncbi:LysR family transcriptional regulator [Rhizobium leguminosarum]|uniref:LysR family transcriptional regulator n=1 Tax=Rhizobium leguminosarum TaxID=384 RepID=A0AAJ1AEJ7_RHILE|nr:MULTISPECIES: LysR family transcriptional regulator [Rhizobium]MBY3157609.1 LysR family transcriptional regulator [Rhizobium laguerreae]MBY3179807.1 LysR family transcriptional regulator [Rhizobium leguminosarum]MBY3192840.1 LysR family transcriptional regulator [Rhizobium laguerreae]MBY3195087.1 LysR family transcriptional regulator [Rhizobium laguerreae]MBY3347933.1 LysR family transcriptional regulator [Rhizobium laguerreae]
MATAIDHLDWDDLKLFLIVVRCKSMTAAARELKISHSTVSRRLARLEYTVGSALVERTKDGLLLTSAGLVTMRRAEEIENGVNALRSDVSNRDEIRGTVRLATMEGIATLYLSERLVELSSRHPDLDLELVTSPQTVRVARREADLFLSFFKPHGTSLDSQLIGRFKTGLFASQAYLERNGVPSQAADLSEHRFVGYIEELIQLESVLWLEELVPTPKIAFSSNSMMSQMFAASAGAGIVALPEFALSLNLGLVPVLDELSGEREIWMSAHQDLAYLSRVRAVKQFVKELVRRDEQRLLRNSPWSS